MPNNMRKAGMAYGGGGSVAKKAMQNRYRYGGLTAVPKARRGGQPSLLTKLSGAPKKKGMKGCGCGGSV